MKRIRRWKKTFTFILILFLAGSMLYAAKLPVLAKDNLTYGLNDRGKWIVDADNIHGCVVSYQGRGVYLKGAYEVKISPCEIVFRSLFGKGKESFPIDAHCVPEIEFIQSVSNPYMYEVVLIESAPGDFPDFEQEEEDYLDPLRTLLHIAGEQEGNQTVAYTGDFALPAEFMQYLVENKNITFIYTVTYEGTTHTITIPAGTAKEEDGVEYYGPAWLITTYGENSIQNSSGTYIVQPGDTLTKIATILNTTSNDLAIKNNIQNQDLIYVGQSIQY